MHRFLIILLILLFLYVLRIWWKRQRKVDETPVKPSKTKTPRPLKPRTPKDCAECRREAETIRQGVGPLIRRTWGTAQTRGGLKLHLEWWLGYYHFVRPHMSLRQELSQPIARKGKQLPQRYRKRTPVMAVGITAHRWTVKEFISYPLSQAAV